eukprot:CAMPEP_0201571794 /NCGR_PEP_ID=MMETSP0190_2-20130828/14730_1 /ASSEMBLY_ACC=CAM_ASM_000263 /TAXON_ID=37353 /ORGANISM="Rosalina sp." /LENGTH=136 /DNA_ID=CAMNT_0047996819 /DNA_START=55 /DNA_END=465 /DNA_ORIENTATION=+
MAYQDQDEMGYGGQQQGYCNNSNIDNQNQNQNQQNGGKKVNKVLAHQYSLKAVLDNKQVTIFCSDSVTNKSWKIVYTENDYQDIENEYKSMKAAIDYGQIACKFPEYDGGNLIVKCQQPNGGEYEFSLPSDDVDSF